MPSPDVPSAAQRRGAELAGMRALLTPPGWALLESLPPYDEAHAMALGERLRAEGHDPTAVLAALTQSQLRVRARAKFGPFADAMLLTEDGLEQATRLSVAAHHARRYVDADRRRIADLGCGLGADAMAFAGLDRAVLAIDSDELTAAFATVNLRHWADAEVRCHDVTTLDLPAMLEPGDGVWLDPGLRPTGTGRRITDPEAASPPYSFVLDMARRFPATGVKLAPGIARRLLPADAEAQWVSVDGEVVECALWFGPLARDGVQRSALLLRSGAAHELVGDGNGPRTPVGALDAYLHEPDGAVIRAGLVGAAAGRLGAHLIDPAVAYLTSARPVRSPFVQTYAVEEAMPYHLKALRALLRDRGVGSLTIKKRGGAIDPAQLRRQLRLDGDQHATIALTRVAGTPHVLLLRPLPGAASAAG
ncbi:MAG: THUMP-like domain-containing protein [Angustibacter sp.]